MYVQIGWHCKQSETWNFVEFSFLEILLLFLIKVNNWWSEWGACGRARISKFHFCLFQERCWGEHHKSQYHFPHICFHNQMKFANCFWKYIEKFRQTSESDIRNKCWVLLKLVFITFFSNINTDFSNFYMEKTTYIKKRWCVKNQIKIFRGSQMKRNWWCLS